MERLKHEADALPAQRRQFPASEHVELPGRASSNAWVQAFLWARSNTPQDAYFAHLLALGINRISLGVQSSYEDELHLLRRGHSFADAIATYENVRRAGCDNVNIDLIAGMVGEDWDNWKYNIEETIRLSPDSVTIYQMELPVLAVMMWSYS